MKGKEAHDKEQRRAPPFTTKRHALPPPEHAGDPPPLSGDVLPDQSSLGADIPPHVWTMLQQAGELAAARLVQVLQSPRFAAYSPAAQRGLIELALVRAYGLPVRKALNVNLSTSDSDAVAASLADLAANLPENARSAVREALDASRMGEDDPPN
jgi:hypothetical protein